MKRTLRFLLPMMSLLLLTTLGIGLSVTVNKAQTLNYGSNWTAIYYNSTSPGTSPVLSQTNIAQINFNYGAGSPQAGIVNPDNFSIRFQGLQDFDTGTYRFTARANDAIVAYIDGTEILRINGPTGDTFALQTADVVIGAGRRDVVVEFIEFTGQAAVQFYWEPVSLEASVTPGPSPTPTATGLPPIPPGALTATVIRAGVLNVRAAPSLGGADVGNILRGQTYQVVGRNEDATWFLLQLGSFQAWAYGYYLYFNINEFVAPIRSATTVYPLPPGFNDTGVIAQTRAVMKMRAEPNVFSPQTGRIEWGAFLPVSGRTAGGDWYLVLWKGTTGWVYAGYSDIIQGDYADLPVLR